MEIDKTPPARSCRRRQTPLSGLPILIGLATVLPLLSSANPPAATTGFTVNSTADARDANPGDGLCATPGGTCTLRAAIQEANALPGADTITLPSGTYTLSVAGRGEDAAATGDLDITNDLVINGAGAANTVIDGGALDRVFHIVGPTNVEIAGMMIQKGTAPEGGGIFNAFGDRVTITNSTVSGNMAIFGGGILNAGTATLIGSTVSGNRAAGGGGGIESKLGERLVLTDSTISGNTAFAWGGIIAGGTLIITASVISGNTAGGNGGIALQDATMTLDRSTVSNNAATDPDFGDIGGIAIGNSLATITNSVIAGNTAAHDFGGISSGGGITASTVTITNSTISGNRANRNGGGIYNSSGSSMNLKNVTVTNNSGIGGGITNSGNSVTLSNALLAGNSDPSGQATDCSGPLTSQGYNLIENTTGCTISGDTTGNTTGQEANLGPLANNGGPTQTHALLAGSPAIDSGNPAPPGSGGNACEAADQRGVARPGGTACDIGAYESEFTRPPSTPTPTPAQLPRTGGRPPPSATTWAFVIVFFVATLGFVGIATAMIASRRRSG